jgi:hypothetical protein
MELLVFGQPFITHHNKKRKLEEEDRISQDSQSAREADTSPDRDQEQRVTTEATPNSSAIALPFSHLTNGGVLEGEEALVIPPGYFRYEFLGEVPHKIRKLALTLMVLGLYSLVADIIISALTCFPYTIGASG